jgi:solute carrier family 25 2-oxodicarboxylate transporter 21
MPRSALEVNVLAGGGAGLIETSATYPLDLAKTRQQLSVKASASVPATLRDVVREGGMRGLYAGISAPLISEVPRRALKFTMNGVFKERLAVVWPEPRSFGGGVAHATLAGSLAGASETLIHTPFEVVKIRMQQQRAGAGVAATARQVVQAEGALGLYTGLEAYALRQIVWNGGFFGLLGLGNATMPQTAAGSKTLRDFLLGLMAGSTATVLNNPLDVAKSRIQAAKTSAEAAAAAPSGRWSLAVTADILRREGMRGMCKGLPARLYRSAPGHGLLYMGFELISSMIR